MKLNTLEHCTPLVRPLVKKIPDITRAETIPKTYKVGGGELMAVGCTPAQKVNNVQEGFCRISFQQI